ncbi:Carboxypeptidase S1-like B [Pseudocercospora fuligena]|uniref:Carboxypeptidase S1-like B n=1 Tax=Pseudocercospora fuligena TaxID=685502 RepID=A0A8H6VPE9_9PEZI|nr:Carboxypeptidase S1-like B [Pseudocercospora fuligena]
MSFLFRASLLSALAVPSLAQFIPAPTDLNASKGYLDIPVRSKLVPEGTCELTPGVKSYSGYVDIHEDQHIFFWFFEARNEDPKKAPLTVWINGGPGSSSMIGLFQELGPCGVNKDGEVYYNPYAWNNASNMIFIDHPAQVGFSYSKPIPGYTTESGYIVQLPNNTCPDYAADLDCGTYSYPNETDTANSTVNAAPSMWRTLQGFMGAFPEYSRNEFNFATESYGGHYGPIFNDYIEKQNDLIAAGKLKGAHHINLETVLIGNGWYDPLVQYQAYYNFTVYPGNTYDYSPYNASTQAQIYNAMYGKGNCYDQTVDCNTRGINSICSAADNFCADQIEYPLDTITGRDEYDIRELTPDPFPYSFYVVYLNTPKLQKAIGAYVNFSESNSAVGNAFGSTGDDDREEGVYAALRRLIKKGVYLVQFAGDADYNCNWLGGQQVSKNVQAPGFSSAGYVNITTSDKVVHGQVKQSANFAFARVYESGHEVPFYQPLLALEMFERAISGKDIATGKESCLHSDYKTVGTAESTYREGNATIQTKVLPADATYNTTTNAPNPYTNSTSSRTKKLKNKKRMFKPSYKDLRYR